jgi:hypothetical protein
MKPLRVLLIKELAGRPEECYSDEKIAHFALFSNRCIYIWTACLCSRSRLNWPVTRCLPL